MKAEKLQEIEKTRILKTQLVHFTTPLGSPVQVSGTYLVLDFFGGLIDPSIILSSIYIHTFRTLY